MINMANVKPSLPRKTSDKTLDKDSLKSLQKRNTILYKKEMDAHQWAVKNKKIDTAEYRTLKRKLRASRNSVFKAIDRNIMRSSKIPKKYR